MPIIAGLRGMYPDFIYLIVVTNVPAPELNLLVPIALCTGTPAIKYAGSEMSPPPPATASTKPAINTKGHTIINVETVIISVIIA